MENTFDLVLLFGDLYQYYWNFTGVLIYIFCHSGKGYLRQQFQFLCENLKKSLGLNMVPDSIIVIDHLNRLVCFLRIHKNNTGPGSLKLYVFTWKNIYPGLWPDVA